MLADARSPPLGAGVLTQARRMTYAILATDPLLEEKTLSPALETHGRMIIGAAVTILQTEPLHRGAGHVTILETHRHLATSKPVTTLETESQPGSDPLVTIGATSAHGPNIHCHHRSVPLVTA